MDDSSLLSLWFRNNVIQAGRKFKIILLLILLNFLSLCQLKMLDP